MEERSCENEIERNSDDQEDELCGGNRFEDVESEVVGGVVDGEDHEDEAKDLGDRFKKFLEFFLFHIMNRQAHRS